ncbi:MAG TPA: 4'-phosphopantetheinyl transferase superfamily protein [Fluviicola sp.]|nr:4'-phosphopantetheinyl transferase superfamily protein [Fluviicola sp.]
MQHDVLSYQFENDRKLRLAARLMLLAALTENDKAELLTHYTLNSVSKPVIPGWSDFSISHSGNLVLFCESDSDVGIDIELVTELDFGNLASFFHNEEKEYILAGDTCNRFYETWVKKEAVLKAIGTGIVNGLDAFSCLENPAVVNNKKWYFYPLVTDESYKACVSSNQVFEEITLEEFDPRLVMDSFVSKRD